MVGSSKVVAVLLRSDTSPCHEDVDGGHWALSPPDPWVPLHECNLVSQVAPCGDIDSNGDPDHCDNNGESDNCDDVCVCQSLRYAHLWCTSMLTARCVLKRACKALLAHGLAWPRPVGESWKMEVGVPMRECG